MIVIPAAENTELVGMYVADKCGQSFAPGMYQALAILDDDRAFIAGVVISEWRGHDCQVSCATESSAAWRPHVMKAVFSYIFLQLGCVRCTSITRKSNKRCRDFLTGLGFQLEGRMRLGYDGVKDALIYGYLASECRYIQGDSDGDVQATVEATPDGSDNAGPGGIPGSSGGGFKGAEAGTDEAGTLNGSKPPPQEAVDQFWTF